MNDLIFRYIISPWTDECFDVYVSNIMTILIVTCVGLVIYFEIRGGKCRNAREKFFFFAALCNYIVVEMLFYWYIAAIGCYITTKILQKISIDEAKKLCYAEQKGMTAEEIDEQWYESETDYLIRMEQIEESIFDEEELRKYMPSLKVFFTAFFIATSILILIAIFTKGYIFRLPLNG